MSLAAICSNIFGATSAEDIGIAPGPSPGPPRDDRRCPSGLPGNPMNMMAPASAWPDGTRAASGRPEIRYGKDGNRTGDDLMTRRQVASLFGVTSAAVATW